MADDHSLHVKNLPCGVTSALEEASVFIKVGDFVLKLKALR